MLYELEENTQKELTYYQKNKVKLAEQQRQRYHKYKEKHNLLCKERYDKVKDSEEYKLRAKDIRLAYRANNPEKLLWIRARERAKKTNLEFCITEEDIKIPETCPYLGIKLTNFVGQGRFQSYYSIDRIDSTRGYVPGNVQIISYLANRMKQDASIEQLVAFARGVLQVHDAIRAIDN